MNKLLRPIALCMLMLMAGLFAESARGQDPSDFGGPPIARPFQAGVGLPVPARVWVGGNAVGDGVGYRGSYFTGGLVANLGEDLFEGYWTLDARAHISQSGRPFSNIGFVRGMAFEQLAADVRAGIFYDFDADKSNTASIGGFGPNNQTTHTFHQIGFTGEVLNEFFELRANGYLPVGTPDFRFGTPGQGFINNNILIQNGVDSAMQGFDLNAGFRPTILQPWSGMWNIGTYYYRSETVRPFGGVMAGFPGQPVAAMTGIAQINHAGQFGTTGLLGLELHFGGGKGQAIARPAREPEPVRRRDHIVRVHQDPILATNPTTGALWRVVHVDNSAPAGGDGTFERPFNNLAQAQAAAQANEMIFVREGLTPGGNLVGMDAGINLAGKDGLQFLGDGVAHIIPTVERGLYQLENDLDGIRPTISNLGGTAVALANGNTVGGFIIENSNFGVRGGAATNGATIRDNTFTSPVINGVQITAASGTIGINRNTFATTGADAINIVGSTGTINATNNTITDAGLNGISITGSTGVVNVLDSTINTSVQNGVLLTDSTGTLTVFNSLFISNGFAGVRIDKNVAGALVATIDTNQFGNPFVLNPVAPIPPNINNGGNSQAIVSTVTGNVGGVGNLLTTNITNNQINNSLLDGVVVSSGGGANHTVLISNNPNISNNGIGGGGQGISIGVTDGGLFTSQLSATITNNLMQNNFGQVGFGTHVLVNVAGNAQTPQLTIANNSFTRGPNGANGGAGLRFIYAATNTNMNLVDITNNTIGTAPLGVITNDDAIRFDVSGTTRLSMLADSNSLSGGAGSSDGFDLRGTGTSLTQFQMTNNQITGFGASGIQAAVFGNVAIPTMLVEAFSNSIVNNNTGGAAFAGGINLEVGQIAGAAQAGNQFGELIARLKNNIITPNGGPAAAPANTLATINANVNNAASSLTLQMANNTSTQGIFLQNLSPAAIATLNFEDGGGNVPAPPFVAPFVPVGVTNVGAGFTQAFANANYTFPPFRALLPPLP